ncbi:unnamed protein product [Parajaminaea phylloscopi]
MPPPASSIDVGQHLGLVNLGNTCFLNSVLQVLSSTRALHELLHPSGDLALAGTSAEHHAAAQPGDTPPRSKARSRRCSPALLLADEEHRRAIEGTPLTDEQSDQLHTLLPLSAAFRFTLEKTWKLYHDAPVHSSRSVPAVNPKQLLSMLSKKHAQFGFYEQQDAHELLRLLLDAMRMEEMDVIKQFQTTPSPSFDQTLASSSLTSLDRCSLTSLSGTSCSGEELDGLDLAKLTLLPTSSSSVVDVAMGATTPVAVAPGQINGEMSKQRPSKERRQSAKSSDGELTPLPDLVWGGRLASMVVCEGCRHVSHTYEDFLDLSLPLRAEDAVSKGNLERRQSRMRFMSSDRWRMRSGAVASPGATATVGKGSKAGSTTEAAREDILRGTTQDQAFGPAGVSVPTPSQNRQHSPDKGAAVRRRRLGRPASHRKDAQDFESADEAQGNAASTSTWSAWAASLGRSRSARPSTARPSSVNAPSFQATTSGTESDLDRDAVEVRAATASTTSGRPSRPSSTQPAIAAPSAPLQDTVSANGLTAAFEAKTRGSRDLLSALSNASRPSSRTASKSKERTALQSHSSRANSPLSVAGEDSKRATNHIQPAHGHHLSHLFTDLHSYVRHVDDSQRTRSTREPSLQARYIARVFSEASDEQASGTSADSLTPTSAAFQQQVRKDQASTGLILALRTFTSAEVLSDDNAFHCKRCWRRLNPVGGRERDIMRDRRVRKGKDASGSEDSDDDNFDASEDEGQALQGLDLSEVKDNVGNVAPGPVKLVAPQAMRALDGIIQASEAGGTSDEEFEADASTSMRVTNPAVSTLEALEEGVSTPMSRASSLAEPVEGAEGQHGAGGSHPGQDHTSLQGSRSATADVNSGTKSESRPVNGDGHSSTANSSDSPVVVVADQASSGITGPGTLRASSLGGTTQAIGANCQSSMAGEPELLRSTDSGRLGVSEQKGGRAQSPASSAAVESGTSTEATDRGPAVVVSGSDASPAEHSPGTPLGLPSHANNPAVSHKMGPTRPAVAGVEERVSRPLRTKRSTQSIPRRALKRYLIADVPPVLFFHLKRFQMAASSKSSSFFSGGTPGSFKKIDDVVTFPEWLDISEWMAPPREEYDRHGNLKATSDPSVLARQQRRQPHTSDGVITDSGGTAQLSIDAPSTNGGGVGSRWMRWSNRTRVASSEARGDISTETGSLSGDGTSGDVNATTSEGSQDAEGCQKLATATEPSYGAGQVLYRLYGLIAHHGSTMQGGHYTAYVLSDRCSRREARDTGNSETTKSASNPAASSTISRCRQKSLIGGRGEQTRSVRPVNADADVGRSDNVRTGSSESHGPTTTVASGASGAHDDTVLSRLDRPGEAPSCEETSPSVARSGSTQPQPQPQPSADTLPQRRDTREWVYCSDTTVRAATLDEVLKCKNAYLLAYERVEF